MGYDLVVFDVEAAPHDDAAFLDWYAVQAHWTESHGYDDPSVTTPGLARWFHQMIQEFRALNGPFAQRDADPEAPRADYCVGRHLIQMGGPWSEAEHAAQRAMEHAGACGVGFCAVGGVAQVWLPDRSGRLVRHEPGLAMANDRDLPLTSEQLQGWLVQRLPLRTDAISVALVECSEGDGDLKATFRVVTFNEEGIQDMADREYVVVPQGCRRQGERVGAFLMAWRDALSEVLPRATADDCFTVAFALLERNPLASTADRTQEQFAARLRQTDYIGALFGGDSAADN